MKEITLEELLEAGCHFGHQVTRSNPKARDFVFEARDNIQIIDLAKTKEGLDEAAAFVKELGQKGEDLLVVGTKRQAKDIIEKEIARAREVLENDKKDHKGSIFYVTQRWIGGVLTNFSEVSKNFKKLNDLREKIVSPEEKAKYTKKELGQWAKEIQRLESFYMGISSMLGKPGALFIIDSHLENLAVREAHSMNVKTVAIVDTNADPFVIDYPIPANDDAVGSIQLIVTHIIDAYVEGIKSQKLPKDEVKADAKLKDSVSQAPAPKASQASDVKAAAPKKDAKPKVEKQKIEKPKAKPKKTAAKNNT